MYLPTSRSRRSQTSATGKLSNKHYYCCKAKISIVCNRVFLADECELWQSARRMRRNDESPRTGPDIPLREELESRFKAKIVTYENNGKELPGGMCGCCVPDVPSSGSGRIGGRDALLVMFVL